MWNHFIVIANPWGSIINLKMSKCRGNQNKMGMRVSMWSWYGRFMLWGDLKMINDAGLEDCSSGFSPSSDVRTCIYSHIMDGFVRFFYCFKIVKLLKEKKLCDDIRFTHLRSDVQLYILCKLRVEPDLVPAVVWSDSCAMSQYSENRWIWRHPPFHGEWCRDTFSH